MDFYTQAGKIDFLFMGINPIHGVDAVFITALKSFSMDKIRGMYRNMSRMQIVDYIQGKPEYEPDEGDISQDTITRIKAMQRPLKELRLRSSLFSNNRITKEKIS
jgi:hypothetical protein